MARIRTIKPEFFTSADIVKLSPMARLLYIALWCEADKEGRLVWRPDTFKLRYLPGDACDVQDLCDEVVNSGLVVLYGKGYAHIPTFKAHQHINPRESASQIPDPSDDLTRQPRVGTRQPRDSDAQGGREGKGMEGDTHTDASALPDGWVLPKAWGEWAIKETPHWTADVVRSVAAQFADHWHTKFGDEALSGDWFASWRKWCRDPITQKAHAPQRVQAVPAPSKPITVPSNSVAQTQALLRQQEEHAAEVERQRLARIAKRTQQEAA